MGISVMKIKAFMLSVLLMLGLCGCAEGSEADAQQAETENAKETEEALPTEQKMPEPESGSMDSAWNEEAKEPSSEGDNEDMAMPDGTYKLPQPYAKYVEVLEQIIEEQTDPNGRVYNANDWERMNFEHNCFAITDIDGDGRQELVFNFNESCLGYMCEVIYGYDEESDTLREELAVWPNTTYYSNGIVKVPDSHNHGWDPESRGIWPYTLYQYEEETDSYQILYYVTSWDEQAHSENFPGELDTDGDGVLYYVLKDGETVGGTDAVPLNREEYESWEDTMIPAGISGKIKLTYHYMTKEAIESIGNAYEWATDYTAWADRWYFREEYYHTGGDYLLYDMDCDGSPELITSITQGSGRYADNHFYSLTDDGELVEMPLVRLRDGKENESIADFDIAVSSLKAYQDKDGVVYYEGSDYTRDGAYYGYAETGFYYLKAGTVYQDCICKYYMHEDRDTGDAEVSYYKLAAQDEEITEAQYEEIRENYVKGMAERDVYMNWVYFTANERAGEEIPAELIRLKLLESFLGSRQH